MNGAMLDVVPFDQVLAKIRGYGRILSAPTVQTGKLVPFIQPHPLSFAFAQQLPQRGRRGRFAPGVCHSTGCLLKSGVVGGCYPPLQSVILHLRLVSGIQKQAMAIHPQKIQDSTHLPNKIPSPKQNRQQQYRSFLRHICISSYQKSCRRGSPAAFVLFHSMRA